MRGERLQREVLAASPETGFAPPLARWDSFWYYNIARYGYAGDFEESQYSGGFLPLYPWAMRVVHRLTGMELFTAGLWISRLSLLAALLLLGTYARQLPVGGSPQHVAAAYLAFPSAFILVSASAAPGLAPILR